VRDDNPSSSIWDVPSGAAHLRRHDLGRTRDVVVAVARARGELVGEGERRDRDRAVLVMQDERLLLNVEGPAHQRPAGIREHVHHAYLRSRIVIAGDHYDCGLAACTNPADEVPESRQSALRRSGSVEHITCDDKHSGTMLLDRLLDLREDRIVILV
jgi:hypothetical protein